MGGLLEPGDVRPERFTSVRGQLEPRPRAAADRPLGRPTCAYPCLGFFGSPVSAARFSRAAFVSG